MAKATVAATVAPGNVEGTLHYRMGEADKVGIYIAIEKPVIDDYLTIHDLTQTAEFAMTLPCSIFVAPKPLTAVRMKNGLNLG